MMFACPRRALAISLVLAGGCHPDATDDSALDMLGDVARVAAGYDHSCALTTEGALRCWGGGEEREMALEAPGPYRAVSAGWRTTCALTARAGMQCWQAGGAVVEVAGSYTSVHADEGLGCGLTDAGEPYCTDLSTGEATLTTTGTFSDFAWSLGEFCGIDAQGTLLCSDEPDLSDRPTEGSYQAIAIYEDDACALTEGGEVVCWGDARLDGPWSTLSWTAVTLGYEFGCALADTGTVECWGDGSDQQTFVPLDQFVDVSAGYRHTCAVATRGEVLCFGSDDGGQLAP
ncbi:MAG: hypothetical protein ABIO70_13460 [Pseudomonadota bacterium]